MKKMGVFLFGGLICVWMCGCRKTAGQESAAETPLQTTETVFLMPSEDEAYWIEGEVIESSGPLEALPFAIEGLSDESLSVLGLSRLEISEVLKEWTEKNGYSSAEGAVFYDPMWIRFSESRYSMDCQLVLGISGNGVAGEERAVLTMDYHKDSGKLYFRKGAGTEDAGQETD